MITLVHAYSKIRGHNPVTGHGLLAYDRQGHRMYIQVILPLLWTIRGVVDHHSIEVENIYLSTRVPIKIHQDQAKGLEVIHLRVCSVHRDWPLETIPSQIACLIYIRFD